MSYLRNDLEDALHKAFDQRLGAQDATTLNRLRLARLRALEDGASRGFWSWLRFTPWSAVPLALAASIVLAVLVFPLSQGSNAGLNQWSEDMAMLEVDAGLDFDDELDFYLWLDADG
jgi:hypothetical protein